MKCRLPVVTSTAAVLYALLPWGGVYAENIDWMRIENRATEQWAVYNVCAGIPGNLGFSYRTSSDTFVIRCPEQTKPRITIPRCKGVLSFDQKYNVLVACPDGRVFPIIRGPYPR